MAKKIISILLALSMMLTVFAACNNEPVVDETPDDGQQQEDIQGNDKVEEPFDGILKLVVDGVSDYVIVRGEDAYISEVTASTELQSYIKQISGVEIPIVTDATAPVEKEIVVGKTNREADGEFDREELGDDGLVIKTNGKKLFLVGGEQRGTLYAVYTFLEEYLGCRWYTPLIEKVPEMKTISVEKIDEDKQIPVFEFRDTDWNFGSARYGSNSFAPKLKLNGHTQFDTTDVPEYGGRMNYILYCHTFVHLVPPTVYYNDHPEYYADKIDDVNAANDSNCPQLCLTNPEVLAIATEYARSYCRDNPKGIFSISQNDNQNYCKCDNCLKAYAEDGNYSDVLIRFVNSIATELKDEFPDVIFDTFAYQYTRSVSNVKPADNVVIRLCSIEACCSHPFEDCDYGKSESGKTFAEELKEWSNLSDKLYVWYYTCNYTHFAAPFPNFDNLLKDVRFAADNNVIGVFEEGKFSGTEVSEFGNLRTYLISKILWDPYMSEEEYYRHMDDYLEGVYGPGWTYIREFINLIEDESDSSCFSCFADIDEIFNMGNTVEVHSKDSIPEDLTSDMIRNYESADWSKYWNFFKDIIEEPSVLLESERLFKLAMAEAETDIQKQELNEAYIQVEYLRSYYWALKLEQGEGSIGKIIANYFAKHPDEFTSQEKRDLRVAIIKLSREQSYAEYTAYNRALAEKIKSCGILSIAWGKYLYDIDSLNLSATPEDWYE